MRADQRKHHIIYKTTCSVTSKYYIGMHSTNDLDDSYYGSGKRLRRSLNKYGEENHVFEVLEHLPSRSELSRREAEIVNLNLLKDPLCMNLKEGGTGGWDHCNNSFEHQSKAGKAGGKIGGRARGKRNNPIGFITYNQNASKEQRILNSLKAGQTQKLKGTTNAGKVIINNGEKQNTVSKSEVETFLAAGYVVGLLKVFCNHCGKYISPQNLKRWGHINSQAPQDTATKNQHSRSLLTLYLHQVPDFDVVYIEDVELGHLPNRRHEQQSAGPD
jgi:hypothetical protein